jgi:uncharacterized repeat protein (TIGR03833 family)
VEFFKNVYAYITMNQHFNMENGTNRRNIKPGSSVGIVLKEDQRSGKITRGIVKRILTSSLFHPNGIKVELMDGKVGRVKVIHS